MSRSASFASGTSSSLKLLAGRSWLALLILGPLAFVGERAGWSSTLVFLLAGAGLAPSAALLGEATEEIAAAISANERHRPQSSAVASLGAKIGALLNASFGNLPDIIITVLALTQGYIALTKAAIVGSVLANAAGLGLGMLVGGLKNGPQRFDADEAGHHIVLLAIVVAALALPSLYLHSTHAHHEEAISLVTAGVLLASYTAYLLYSIFHMHGGKGVEEKPAEPSIFDEKARVVPELQGEDEYWSLQRSIGVLALATLIVFASSEALINSVEPFIAHLGWEPIFVGFIVIPMLGSVPQNWSTTRLAYKNNMNVALGISAGAAIQGAIFVAPLLVFISLFTNHLTLVFPTLQIVSLGLIVTIYFLVARDGRSNWLEGVLVLAIYTLVATVFFFVPGQLH
jgi:Ca2+:H+ antiporter